RGSLYRTPPLEPILEEQKYWGEELINILENKCNITYDKKSKTFTEESHHNIISYSPSPIKTKILINIKFKDLFLTTLVNEINGTFRSGYFTSSLILLRKLFENLLILLLQHKYPKDKPGNLEIYFDQDNNRSRFFSELIKNLNERKKEFTNNERNIEQLINRITHLKEKADTTTHLYTQIADKEEIKKIKILEIIELFKIISLAEGQANIFDSKSIL
ncbi:MAG: hypothetical protein ACPKPY_12785, partial [Nitrososphaeraceae archaeon]